VRECVCTRLSVCIHACEFCLCAYRYDCVCMHVHARVCVHACLYMSCRYKCNYPFILFYYATICAGVCMYAHVHACICPASISLLIHLFYTLLSYYCTCVCVHVQACVHACMFMSCKYKRNYPFILFYHATIVYVCVCIYFILPCYYCMCVYDCAGLCACMLVYVMQV
jgi:hypothetical protein